MLKYYNNILGLSNRVAHFVPNTDIRCTFCVLETRGNVGTETFEYIFYSCPSTRTISSRLADRYLSINLTPQIYFSGEAITGNEKENIPLALFLDILRYNIWQCKLNKRKPTLSAFDEEIRHSVNVICKTYIGISEMFENCSLFKHGVDDGEDGGVDQHGRG